LRAGWIGAALLVGVAVAPGGLSVHAAPSEPSPGDRLEIQRLAEVRERLERRRALQRNLQAKVEAWTAEIEALRAQREKTSAVLQSERQQARVLEQQLDRLVPRLLARLAEVEERRAQAAAALADLARKSQSLHLDPRIRARMLALAPLMLERLRGLEAGVDAPSARPDRMIARHAQIERGLPPLMSAQQRLQHEGAQKRRLRQMASDRLRGLEVQVRLLGEEQARLAGRFARDAALVARAEPRADQRAVPDLAGPRGGAPAQYAASDKDPADPMSPPAPVADAWNQVGARAMAQAPGAGPAVAAAELRVDARWPTTPPPGGHAEARRRAAPPKWPSASAAVGGATGLEVAYSLGRGWSKSRAGRARGARSAPLLPMLEGTRGQEPAVHGGPELTIAAAPGQAVAAPVEGRVVFAGRFKSYGLLLILEHEAEYHTLLWGFARLDVRHGDPVAVGQIVGIMDARGDDPPVLHVERRRDGRPVDIAASSNGIQG
jgi:murein DD-endopeptidase MepM/ murein hydrolase activator NlpD